VEAVQAELYQLMPPLTEDEYRTLKADIAERGVLVPIELDEAGHVLDGHHRLRAWAELRQEGVELPDYPRMLRSGWTEEQKRNHVRALNLLRRHLSKEQLREQWAAMRADGMSYQAIAATSGVSDETVRKSTSKNLEVQPITIKGKDNKKRPAKYKPRKPKLPQAPKLTIFAASDIGEEKAKAEAKRVEEKGESDQQVQVTIFSHETKEYYTPPQYIEAARGLMGGIDLDPASCKTAQEWIRAGAYFSMADDGYAQEWFGRVWLNPPYSKEDGESNQDRWSRKLIAEYKAGRVQEAVLLVKAALGYKWFEDLWWNWPVCFARERISFIKADGTSDGQSKQGTAFFYLGPNVDKFKATFRQFGRVIMPEVA